VKEISCHDELVVCWFTSLSTISIGGISNHNNDDKDNDGDDEVTITTIKRNKKDF
jgi:hypothetical protein